MNRALTIKNWNDAGNNYVLKGNPKNKWVGFQETVLIELIKKFHDEFNIVIWTDKLNENDYYCIPYKTVKHLFTDQHKTTGKYPNRWTAIILHHQFMMHSNSQLSLDVSNYYSKHLFSKPVIDLVDDYLIENARAEINIRLGQSKFRKLVLKNFNDRCALTGLTEKSLLTASHIIPWAHKKDFRGDMSNGICLYCEYDMLFDKGYISFTNDLEIILTPTISKLSIQLQKKLTSLIGKRLTQPTIKPLNENYLSYHRENILLQQQNIVIC